MTEKNLNKLFNTLNVNNDAERLFYPLLSLCFNNIENLSEDIIKSNGFHKKLLFNSSELFNKYLDFLQIEFKRLDRHAFELNQVQQFINYLKFELYNNNNESLSFPSSFTANTLLKEKEQFISFNLNDHQSLYNDCNNFPLIICNANAPELNRNTTWIPLISEKDFFSSNQNIYQDEAQEENKSNYKSASDLLKRHKTVINSDLDNSNSLNSFNKFQKDIQLKTKDNDNNINPEYNIYEEILGGETKQDILDWVLGMRLSKLDKMEECDISGLHFVKKLLRDKIINPILRPELHVGLHQAPKGILLFGPPGTGKTMLAKWMATASGATFFEVTPSSVISKYHGETETLIRTLFKVAEIHNPSIIFIDEIDSLLGKRRDKEDDSTIRMKNQLLQMIDGVSSHSNKMVVLVGATNRPDMLDEAALRRLSKRVLIPLPDDITRRDQIKSLLEKKAIGGCTLSQEELLEISRQTEGWNGSDLKSLCAKAAEYSYDEAIEKFDGIENIPDRSVFRKITFDDFQKALNEVHPSSNNSNYEMESWHKKYGNL